MGHLRLRRTTFWLCILVVQAVGCSGKIGGSSSTPAGVDPGRSPLRRLTRYELDNTLRDVLGDSTHPASKFLPPDQGHFSNNADVQSVNGSWARQYMSLGEDISLRLRASIETLAGCAANGLQEDACAQSFIDSIGRRLFRRPLLTDERARMLGVYRKAKAAYDHPTAMELMLQTFLQSPQFLYRIELAPPGQIVPLDGYQLASRLSYFL